MVFQNELELYRPLRLQNYICLLNSAPIRDDIKLTLLALTHTLLHE